MRLVLWMFCVILLRTAFSSDTFMQVDYNNHDELEDRLRAVQHTRDEESMIFDQHQLSKLHESMKENFDRMGHVVDRDQSYFSTATEKRMIRHKKHSRNYHQYHANGNHENDVRNPKEKDAWDGGFVDENKPARIPMDMELNDSPLSPVSQSKLESLGTDEKVKERFQSTYNTLPMSITRIQEGVEKAALEHFQDMKMRTVCKSPIPKIVKVDQVYPNVLKDYYPPCTIIHQCSEESGCCPSKKMKCSVSAFQNITLYFKVMTRNLTGDHKLAYEGLQFINHTDCKCLVEPDNRKVRDTSAFAELSTTEFAPKPPKSSYFKKCARPCPFPFFHRISAEGTCLCECSDQNRECFKLKRGEVYFSLADSHCLYTEKCMYPSCSYGRYLRKVGRCPNYKERRVSS